jgi:hypothetical protein
MLISNIHTQSTIKNLKVTEVLSPIWTSVYFCQCMEQFRMMIEIIINNIQTSPRLSLNSSVESLLFAGRIFTFFLV